MGCDNLIHFRSSVTENTPLSSFISQLIQIKCCSKHTFAVVICLYHQFPMLIRNKGCAIENHALAVRVSFRYFLCQCGWKR